MYIDPLLVGLFLSSEIDSTNKKIEEANYRNRELEDKIEYLYKKEKEKEERKRKAEELEKARQQKIKEEKQKKLMAKNFKEVKKDLDVLWNKIYRTEHYNNMNKIGDKDNESIC